MPTTDGEGGGAAEAALVVTFPRDVYSVDAVKRAAYRLSDRLSCAISLHDGDIRCALTPLTRSGLEDCNALVARLRNEVLDQDLRERIAAETVGIRNVVLAYAFSATGLQE
jgi:His-Xaa-Ser system protein HxsD